MQGISLKDKIFWLKMLKLPDYETSVTSNANNPNYPLKSWVKNNLEEIESGDVECVEWNVERHIYRLWKKTKPF